MRHTENYKIILLDAWAKWDGIHALILHIFSDRICAGTSVGRWMLVVPFCVAGTDRIPNYKILFAQRTQWVSYFIAKMFLCRRRHHRHRHHNCVQNGIFSWMRKC